MNKLFILGGVLGLGVIFLNTANLLALNLIVMKNKNVIDEIINDLEIINKELEQKNK